MIREQALKIYKKLYDTEDVADEDLEFKASSSWFYLFLIKNKIKCSSQFFPIIYQFLFEKKCIFERATTSQLV